MPQHVYYLSSEVWQLLINWYQSGPSAGYQQVLVFLDIYLKILTSGI